jgi:hypothetical protein
MSKYLMSAALELQAAWKENLSPVDSRILRVLNDLILHLEAQQSQPVPLHRHETYFNQKLTSLPVEESETPSSVATETPAETSDTSVTSSQWSFPVNPDGSLEPSQVQVILDWFSSLRFHGNPPGVEIGVTLTSKASIPPAGSHSPSTAAPHREASGVAGERKPNRRDFIESGTLIQPLPSEAAPSGETSLTAPGGEEVNDG